MGSRLPTKTPSRSVPLLEVRGLGRRIPNRSQWLYRNIDLNIAPGDRLALAGPTGSGKSLILRAVALLDPVDRGDIAWCGEPIRDASVPAYRRRVLYLQQGSPVIEGTVEDNLKLPFSLHLRRGETFPRTQARELVAGLGKDSSFFATRSNNLSGGERQIVALLRALLVDPTVLLLDEPSAALDPQTTASLEGLVQSWHSAAAAERAYVWVSHDPLQAERIADRVVYVKDGTIARSS